jgi:hypothetical protein
MGEGLSSLLNLDKAKMDKKQKAALVKAAVFLPKFITGCG